MTTTEAAPSLALRRASSADADSILALKRRAYARYVPRIGAEPMPMTADYARFIAEDEVWMQDGESGPVASLVLQVHPDHLVLWSVAVAPEMVGHGLGQALLAFTEERARAQGLGEVRLFTNERMVENRAWYARHGFRETGLETHNGRRIVHMCKRLPHGPALGEPIDAAPARRPERITVLGRHVALEPLSAEAHAAPLYAAAHGPGTEQLWAYMSIGPFDQIETWRLWCEGAQAQGDPLFFAIRPLGQEPAGVASYMRIAPEHRVIEVGNIWFAPSLQRSPAATEAMYLMARHAFEVLGYRRYEWKCNALNEASRRAALRLGFAFEGVFRQHMIIKGRNRDTAWYAMLDCDWPRVKANFERWLAPENFDPDGRQRVSLSALNTSEQVRG